MAHISIHRKHHLGLEEARTQVEKIAESLKEKLNSEYSWKDDTLHFKRSGANGSIAVSKDSIDLEITLGLTLRPLKGMIEKTIYENLDKALDKDSDLDIG
jgi:putative polyhydroxyalkanoate system protein